jgi:16S rRNA (uracil1498-N3)-methyltransferase
VARRRFFVDFIRGGSAELRGDEARHLTRVLRVEAGQRFEISDQNAAWLAEVVEARGEHVLFRVLEPVETAEVPVRIALYAALIKFDRLEWLIEKATELGVETIRPVETARSEKGLFEASRKRLERWQRIARESGQQSRRLRAPEVRPAERWQSVLAAPASQRYVLEEAGAPALLRALPRERPPFAEVSLLTGPEGGWTDVERQAAASAGWQPISLGPQVLRAETAALAAIAVIVNAWLP